MAKKTQEIEIDLSEFIEQNPPWAAGVLDIMENYHAGAAVGDKHLANRALAALREYEINPQSEGYASQVL